jgi:hypothetical protein
MSTVGRLRPKMERHLWANKMRIRKRTGCPHPRRVLCGRVGILTFLFESAGQVDLD